MDNIKFTPEQEKMLKLLNGTSNAVIFGKAGSGKTTVLSAFMDTTDKKIMLLATTGLAASLLPKAATIHGGLRLQPLPLYPLDYMPRYKQEERFTILAAETVIIDEASMLRSDLLSTICRVLRRHSPKEHQHKVTGNKQLILIGDPLQLPAVTPDDARPLVEEAFKSTWFFATDEFSKGNFKTLELQHVHRQESDSIFLHILNAIRTGDHEKQQFPTFEGGPDRELDAIEAFNELVTVSKTPPHGSTVLCAYNYQADAVNSIMDKKLPGKPFQVSAAITGNFNIKDCPAPARLTFRIGTRVIMIMNKPDADGGYEYSNGTTGFIVDYNAEKCVATIKLDNGRVVESSWNTWYRYKPQATKNPETGDVEIELEAVAECRALGFRKGYACTIHRSQGMSLDKVHIELGKKMFEEGQLYTALSRCRTIENLSVSRPLRHEDVMISSEALKFVTSASSRLKNIDNAQSFSLQENEDVAVTE